VSGVGPLNAEIERIDPAVVVTLGNVATHALLDTDEDISNRHGKQTERNSMITVPICLSQKHFTTTAQRKQSKRTFEQQHRRLIS
jgi:uracil-DNA glycosylase